MRVFVVLFLTMVVMGCAKHRPCDQYIGPSRDLCLLKMHGVSVLRAGQTVKIVLPSERLFVNDTAELAKNYKPVLAVMANFIRSFSTISVKVAAFSNHRPLRVKTKGESIGMVQTRAQAQKVLRFLSRHHINARLLYAVGKNGHDPVAWRGSRIGRYLNRRVEITFRYYLDNKAWY